MVSCGARRRRACAAQIDDRCAAGRRARSGSSAAPRAAPVAVGSNRAFSVTDWLGFSADRQSGPRHREARTRHVPPSLMVTGAAPVDVSVTGCVDAVAHRHVAEG